jgi:hypothetical protein
MPNPFSDVIRHLVEAPGWVWWNSWDHQIPGELLSPEEVEALMDQVAQDAWILEPFEGFPEGVEVGDL